MCDRDPDADLRLERQRDKLDEMLGGQVLSEFTGMLRDFESGRRSRRD